MQQSRVTEIRDEVGVRNSSMPYKTECQKRKKKENFNLADFSGVFLCTQPP